MLPLRFVGLVMLLFAIQAWCKPAKSLEGAEYSDDDPSDYTEEETPEDDYPGTIEEPPEIVSKPESIHVRSGSTISLHCLLEHADNFAVTWKRGDESLYYDSVAMTQDTKRIIRLPNNTLVIYNATTNDTSNNYECSILREPVITLNHRVLVEDTPVDVDVIHVTPRKKVEVNAGESVTLGCETKIEPAPEVKWYYENVRIRSNERLGSHITFTNVSRRDSGRYQCLVEDGSGSPPVAAITLIVNYAPEIEAKRELVHTGLGVESDLTCIVHAHPHAKVTWYKDLKEIQPEAGRIEMKVNKLHHTLKILHTDQKDFGKYTCVAVNRMGRAEKVISLTGAPSQAIVYGTETTKTENGLILKWRLESYSPITEYKLEYRRKGDDQWIILKPTVTNGKGSQFVVEHAIKNLQPGSYEAILTARNDFGWSQPSEPHVFTGEYEIKEVEAENVKGSSSAASHPAIAITSLFLVVSSCIFTNL